MPPFGPDPDAIHPNGALRRIAFIKNVIHRPNILVGDYTYYDDPDGAEEFEKRVTHHYDFIGDRLIIGKFCAIGRGIEFIMNGANHRMNSATTYPFNLFGHGWERAAPDLESLPLRGIRSWATTSGSAKASRFCQGSRSAMAPSSAPMPPSPATSRPTRLPRETMRARRQRFDDALIAHLLEIRWWDWPAQKIFENLEILCGRDLERLRALR